MSEQGVHPTARPPFAIKARKKHIDIVYRIGAGSEGGRDVKDTYRVTHLIGVNLPLT